MHSGWNCSEYDKVLVVCEHGNGTTGLFEEGNSLSRQVSIFQGRLEYSVSLNNRTNGVICAVAVAALQDPVLDVIGSVQDKAEQLRMPIQQLFMYLPICVRDQGAACIMLLLTLMIYVFSVGTLSLCLTECVLN